MYKGKTITLTNCCDEKFESIRKICSQTSINIGKADRVLEFSPDMMDNDFKEKNKKLLSIKRGSGLWLWKPYFILKALESVPDNHYLIYLDAGVIVINEFKYLIDNLEASQQDIMVFELPLVEEEWTKKEVYKAIIPNFNKSVNQILSGYIIIKNTPSSRNMIEEWLLHIQNPICILPETISTEENYWNFVQNRDDQSIWSLICHKHNIIPFRDPSQFGEHPYYYAWQPSYTGYWRKYSFRPHHYENSKFPQILISTRLRDPKDVLRTSKIAKILTKLGIYKFLYKLQYKPFLSTVKKDDHIIRDESYNA